jgi:hypothetical protein
MEELRRLVRQGDLLSIAKHAITLRINSLVIRFPGSNSAKGTALVGVQNIQAVDIARVDPAKTKDNEVSIMTT